MQEVESEVGKGQNEQALKISAAMSYNQFSALPKNPKIQH